MRIVVLAGEQVQREPFPLFPEQVSVPLSVKKVIRQFWWTFSEEQKMWTGKILSRRNMMWKRQART